LNDCEMQHNAAVGLFTEPSIFNKKSLSKRRGFFESSL